jgi:hypothetical protein
LDQDLVPAGADADGQLLLDAGEVEMVLTEEMRACRVVVEPYPAAGAAELG